MIVTSLTNEDVGSVPTYYADIRFSIHCTAHP